METVLPYISQMPDLMNLQHTPEESQEIASRLGDEVEENYQNFLDSLTDPMPFWMYEGEQGEETSMELSWEPAYDFEGQPFTYRVTGQPPRGPVPACGGRGRPGGHPL